MHPIILPWISYTGAFLYTALNMEQCTQISLLYIVQRYTSYIALYWCHDTSLYFCALHPVWSKVHADRRWCISSRMLSCFHILKYSSDDARDDGDYDLFLTVKMLRHDDNDEKHKADHTGCSLVPLENQVKGSTVARIISPLFLSSRWWVYKSLFKIMIVLNTLII